MAELRRGALDGIRVLEFSIIQAGPVCGMTLSDLGADVVKVEPPGGEPFRHMRSVVPTESKVFHACNRGKRSLVVDLLDERGRELIYRMLPSFDVVVVNYRPGVAEKLGIDYATLRRYREDLIYVDLTAFGHQGPERDRAGSDIVIQAYSGLMAGDGKLDDVGAPAQVSCTAIGDQVTGIAGSMGVCAALYHRQLTGEGQIVRGSLLRSAIYVQSRHVMTEPVTDSVDRAALLEEVGELKRRGAGYAELIATRKRRLSMGAQWSLYFGAYEAQDGALVFGAISKKNRDALRQVLGITDDRSDEPDYDALAPENEAALVVRKGRVRQLLRTRTVAEWLADLDAAGAPAAPVLLPEEISDDPHALEAGMFVDVEHEVTGPQRIVGPLIELSATPTSVQGAAPRLGRDTDAVLAEAGLDAAEVAELRASGVVA